MQYRQFSQNTGLYLVGIFSLLMTGCASSLYVEQVSEGNYLVDIYRLPDVETAEQRWQEEINTICNGQIRNQEVTITMETFGGANCNTCAYSSGHKAGTYTAWGKVQCETESFNQ